VFEVLRRVETAADTLIKERPNAVSAAALAIGAGLTALFFTFPEPSSVLRTSFLAAFPFGAFFLCLLIAAQITAGRWAAPLVTKRLSWVYATLAFIGMLVASYGIRA